MHQRLHQSLPGLHCDDPEWANHPGGAQRRATEKRQQSGENRVGGRMAARRRKPVPLLYGFSGRGQPLARRGECEPVCGIGEGTIVKG